jgi:hypothetical protein
MHHQSKTSASNSATWMSVHLTVPIVQLIRSECPAHAELGVQLRPKYAAWSRSIDVVWLGAETNATAAASTGVAAVRARPLRIVSTRVRRLAAPTPVISEVANAAICPSALGVVKSNWRGKFTRSVRSTASTKVAPGVCMVS